MKTTVLFFLVGALASCADAQNSSTLAAQSDGNTTLEDFEQSLQGTWERPCLHDVANGNYVESIAFAGVDGAFTILTKDYFYSDTNCTLLTLIKSQSLTVGDINPNGNGWTYFATLSAQSYMPQTAQAAATLNAAQACGYTQWVAGSATDTSATGCAINGGISDTLYLNQGSLSRALDEVLAPTVVSGVIPRGVPYSKKY